MVLRCRYDASYVYTGYTGVMQSCDAEHLVEARATEVLTPCTMITS